MLMFPGWPGAESAEEPGRLPAVTQAGPDGTAVAMRKGFEEVSGWVTKAANLVPPDKYRARGLTIDYYGLNFSR
jgi:hypothetical protein